MGGFAEAEGGFDGEFVEGVEAVFYVGGFDAGLGFVDAGFYLPGGGGGLVGFFFGEGGWEGGYGIVDDSFDRDEDFKGGGHFGGGG